MACIASCIGFATACTKSNDGASASAVDSGVVDGDFDEDGRVADDGPDAGLLADANTVDATLADSGPLPCRWDQGGEQAFGCAPGQVCNVLTGRCGPGQSCTSDDECDACSDLLSPRDCGHGLHLTAWCDLDHGRTCTRSRAACETCTTDQDCGRMHPDLGGVGIRCVAYGNDRFCATPSNLGCPDGFSASQEGLCVRTDGCPEVATICPTADPSQNCPGNEQICPGAECPGTGGALCTTNVHPGLLGTCIGACRSNTDCPSTLPVCNPRNGICVASCTKGSCSQGEVCHSDGFCARPCANDTDCTSNPKYGADTHCNLPGQPPPRIFKEHRDENACAPLGCELPEDCGAPGLVCDRTHRPPACVAGCFTGDDCLAGEVCRAGTPGAPYSRSECRGLLEKTDDEQLGACCNPGCTNRILQCGLHEFCCGEPRSPYEDPASCLQTSQGVKAQGGECFPMAPPAWCAKCTGEPGDCNSGWTAGFNTDPAINGGAPFQEQEFCFGLSEEIAVCSVTCNPAPSDSNHQCPRQWICGPVFVYCQADADCGGLPCVGADPEEDKPGRCLCGEGGIASATCPATYPNTPTIEHPRCVASGNQGQLFCAMAYNCTPPPGDPAAYPATCDFE